MNALNLKSFLSPIKVFSLKSQQPKYLRSLLMSPPTVTLDALAPSRPLTPSEWRVHSLNEVRWTVLCCHQANGFCRFMVLIKIGPHNLGLPEYEDIFLHGRGGLFHALWAYPNTYIYIYIYILNMRVSPYADVGTTWMSRLT